MPPRSPCRRRGSESARTGSSSDDLTDVLARQLVTAFVKSSLEIQVRCALIYGAIRKTVKQRGRAEKARNRQLALTLLG